MILLQVAIYWLFQGFSNWGQGRDSQGAARECGGLWKSLEKKNQTISKITIQIYIYI